MRELKTCEGGRKQERGKRTKQRDKEKQKAEEREMIVRTKNM
jgi:hypothetical protein